MSKSGTSTNIHKVLALAKKTFARIRASERERKRILAGEEFADRLQDLSAEMNKLTPNDVGLQHSPAARGESPFSEKNGQQSAPVTYIGVSEQEDFTLGVFIVKPNQTMPLHNHPNMNGCLKVLQGSLEVACYDQIPLSELKIPEDLPAPLQSRADLVEKGFVVPANKPVVVTVTPESNPLLVHPNKDNLHQMRTVGSTPAAFIDVLGPPYNHGDLRDHGDFERRECTFYKLIKFRQDVPQGRSGVWWLHRRPCEPEDYYCGSEPYRGPSIGNF